MPLTDNPDIGELVPIPILEFNESIENIGVPVIELANEKAFTAEANVLVAVLAKFNCNPDAVEEPNVTKFESKYVFPATDNLETGVVVPTPKKRFVSSQTKPVAPPNALPLLY